MPPATLEAKGVASTTTRFASNYQNNMIPPALSSPDSKNLLPSYFLDWCNGVQTKCLIHFTIEKVSRWWWYWINRSVAKGNFHGKLFVWKKLEVELDCLQQCWFYLRSSRYVKNGRSKLQSTFSVNQTLILVAFKTEIVIFVLKVQLIHRIFAEDSQRNFNATLNF